MASMTTIQIDCQNVTGELEHIWTAIGFDEINWSYSERGKDLLKILKDEVMERSYYVRNHNTFTSGNELSSPANASTNIYMEDEDGNPIYNFEIIDKIYDSYVENHFIPIIELDFMPFDLVPNKNTFQSDWTIGRDVGKEDYDLVGWKSPPKDYQKWKDLVERFVNHLYQRYGQQTENWYFEVWNEPNLTNYWLGTLEDYCKLYDYSVEAIKSINPKLKIGGPATTDLGQDFLNQFLEHITNGINYANNQIGTKIDFISFHTKGAYYVPRRSYCHKVQLQYPSLTKMLNDIRNNLNVCNKYHQLNHLPIFVDECDPAVGTIYGIYDNPNFVICNTEYYPSMVAAMIYNILLISSRIKLITTWAFYMEGKRLFEGNRTLVTNYNLHLPILNGLKLLSKLKSKRLLIEINHNKIPIHGISTFDQTNSDIQLLLFSHVDDYTVNDKDHISIIFNNIQLKTVLIKHYRIDTNNNNIYSEWIKMGKPDYLNEQQLIYLKNYQQLKLLNPSVEYQIENNQLVLEAFLFSTNSIDFFEIINQTNNI